MPLYAEVNRQNHGDNGYSAEHQNRKENFDYHRASAYQNDEKAELIFAVSCPSRQPFPKAPAENFSHIRGPQQARDDTRLPTLGYCAKVANAAGN